MHHARRNAYSVTASLESLAPQRHESCCIVSRSHGGIGGRLIEDRLSLKLMVVSGTYPCLYLCMIWEVVGFRAVGTSLQGRLPRRNKRASSAELSAPSFALVLAAST